jgi:hypothetical protein
MGHVFARLAGHGVVVLPHWPYTFDRAPASAAAVTVTHWREDGPHEATVDPAVPASAPGIADVSPGPDNPYWTIETTGFTVPWPSGFSLESGSNPADRTAFYLCGPHDECIFFQGPAEIADPLSMAAPGQEILSRRILGGVHALDLGYDHEGASWRQSVYLYPRAAGKVLVCTAQAPEPYITPTREALEWMLGL